MAISKVRAEVLGTVCVSCLSSQGESFDGKACRTCTDGLLALMPDKQEKKGVESVGLITAQDIELRGTDRIVA